MEKDRYWIDTVPMYKIQLHVMYMYLQQTSGIELNVGLECRIGIENGGTLDGRTMAWDTGMGIQYIGSSCEDDGGKGKGM
jgi:hypothetical protein